MKIAIIQISSRLDYQENLEKINKFIIQAKAESPDLDAVFLPEVFYSMSDGTKPTEFLIEHGNMHFNNIRALAIEHKLYLLGGSAATQEGGKIFNRAYNFSPKGEDLGHYDKRCLFSLTMEGQLQNSLDESRTYCAGNEEKILVIGEFHMGLSICFDLRFPELYRSYFSQGVNLLSIASAFTASTGKAHWKSLLRARAIENQSYVVAANQWGKHNDKMTTYGHSMIIDPWGEVLADCGEGEGYAIAELKLERVQQVRSRMNVSPYIKGLSPEA